MIALMASTSSDGTSTQPVKQISYKEKLQAARNRRTAGGAGVATQPSQSAMTTPPPPVPQEQRVTTPPTLEQAPPTLEHAPPTLEQAPPPSTNEDDDDDTRRQLRTLQGLLLKHRGGPGFGAGRLKDMEANRLKDALAQMTNLLRAESGSGSPTLIAETTASSSSVAAPAPASVTAPAPASVAAPPPASDATASSSSETDLDAAIEYATATIQMFQLAPAGQKPVLLSILRAALAATVEALDGGAASATPPSPPPVVGPASMEDVMASAEYVAATMNMYKLAPVAQKVVSATVLRAALVTAMGQVDVCGGGGAAAAVVTPPSPPAVEMSPEERFGETLSQVKSAGGESAAAAAPAIISPEERFGETLSRVKSAGGESAAAAAPAIISPEERFGDTLARVKRAGEEGNAPAEEVPAAEGYGMSSFGEIAAAMPLSQSIVDEMTAGDDGSAAVVREEDPRDIRALEKAYENMKRIGGNGRFGLDPNLSPADAQEVAESLIDMRQIFLKELDAANVAATDTTTTATTATAPAPITEETEKPRTEWEHNSGGTRFKQLLEQAKKSKGM